MHPPQCVRGCNKAHQHVSATLPDCQQPALYTLHVHTHSISGKGALSDKGERPSTPPEQQGPPGPVAAKKPLDDMDVAISEGRGGGQISGGQTSGLTRRPASSAALAAADAEGTTSRRALPPRAHSVSAGPPVAGDVGHLHSVQSTPAATPMTRQASGGGELAREGTMSTGSVRQASNAAASTSMPRAWSRKVWRIWRVLWLCCMHLRGAAWMN